MALTGHGAQTSRRGFVASQVHALRPLEFVTFITPLEDGFTYMEVARGENDVVTVEVGGIPTPKSAVGKALQALGFASTGHGRRLRWKGSALDAAADIATAVLDGPLAVAPEAPLDVHHGSRRAVVELERKLLGINERIRAVVASLVGGDAVTEDLDGDLEFSFESTRVWVGTRVLAGAEIVVRVFAPAAVEVEPSPALGLFIAQANFALALGKFSLDAVGHAVWFEEALVGEAFSDDELRRVIELVAVTTNEYDEQIARLFGGRTAREAALAGTPHQHENEKPGSSGYL